jgi:hypothetical protein
MRRPFFAAVAAACLAAAVTGCGDGSSSGGRTVGRHDDAGWRLVDQIRREHVEAVFPESSVNPDIERAIASEAGARIGDPLYADSLGRAGSRGETYAGALAADAEALVRGMSGGRVECRL